MIGEARWPETNLPSMEEVGAPGPRCTRPEDKLRAQWKGAEPLMQPR
jgi:hypothetical protein